MDMKQYIPRIADDILDSKLESKGAVLIEGPKWCGKTTTAAQKAKSIVYLQDPATTEEISLRASLDLSFLLKGESPRLIDEWQDYPELWDAIRMEVDRRDEFGQFMLTGSAVPPDTDKIKHTGTGRITRLMMRPMSLAESGDSSRQVSLASLFKGEFLEQTAEKQYVLEDIAYLICRGGWPKAIGISERAALAQAPDYFEGIVSSDINRASKIKRKEDTTRLIMKSYARNIGSQISYAGILRDIEANCRETISENTLKGYIDDLNKIFIFEDSPAWNPNLRSKTAIRTSDTRYYMDPSVAAAALGAGPGDLVNDLQSMGFFFENMAIRDLRIYADALGGEIRHYRDKRELECDAVIHLRNGSYGLVEIKLGGEKLIKEGIATLSKLEEKLDTTKMKKPAFKMILTAVGKSAFITENGIYVVPITMLGA